MRTVRIPPRLRPLLRLLLIGVLVVAADIATGQLTRYAVTMPLVTVTVIRCVAALTILRYPLAGFLVMLEVDKWDWFWLGMASGSDADRVPYQQWDKGVDLVGLAVAAVVVWHWPDALARRLALGAFVLRAVGVTAFLLTDQRWLLIAFPNVFESAFLLYVLFRTLTGRERMLDGTPPTMLIVLAVVLPKMAQEYFLHVLGERPWDMVEITSWRLADVGLWALVLYGLPLIMLVILVWTSEGRVSRGDPEAQLSTV